MALEETIAEWSKDRPNWQRVILRRVADGKPLSDDEYDKLVEDLVAGKTGEKAEFDLKHVPHTEPKGAQVQLVSISEPDHVNAISSADPLTFSQKGLTVVYGDNGSGKSGYARILKSIARARDEEPVLTDVFRDTAVERPKAKLDVTVGGEATSVPWPITGLPELRQSLRQVLFYDAPSGARYIDAELTFPYKPPALFVMEGLIKACLVIRERIDKKLNENTGKKKDGLPIPDEACKDSEAAKFLTPLSASSTVETLDALIAKCDPTRVEDLKKREKTLAAADSTKEKARLGPVWKVLFPADRRE